MRPPILPSRPLQVWGFPAGYDPNLMGDRCELCRTSNWLEHKLPRHPTFGDMGSAWTCAACATPPPKTNEIPLD